MNLRTVTQYQQAKHTLKGIADMAKSQSNDKPLIRQAINDTMDSLCRDMDLSEYHQNLLADYACTLHP